MSKTKKILSVAVILLVAAGIVGYILFSYGYGQSSYYYLAREYQKLPTPAYLQFNNKVWDDAHANDPSIQSVWSYRYTIRQGISILSADKALQNTLKSEGYKIAPLENFSNGAYQFKATNGKLRLTPYVGIDYDKNDQLILGNKVYVTVERDIND